MPVIPARSPAVQALWDEREALKAVASTAQRLARVFGESRSLKAMQDYQQALEREVVARRAYSAAMKSQSR